MIKVAHYTKKTGHRRIVLRRTFSRAEREVSQSREQVIVLPVSDHIMAYINHSPLSARVLRAAALMAESKQARWTVFYVETDDYRYLSDNMRRQLRSNLNLAGQLGAELITVHGEDIAGQVIQYAKMYKVADIVIGRDWKKTPLKKNRAYDTSEIVDKILNSDLNSNVHVITGKLQDYEENEERKTSFKLPKLSVNWEDMIKTLCIMALAIILGSLFSNAGFSEPNIMIIMIFGILLVAITTSGYMTGILAALISMLFFNYFFTEPHNAFTIQDIRITFPIMLMMALITTKLTASIKEQVENAINREQKTGVLLQTSRSFLRSTGKDVIISKGLDHLAKLLNRGVVCYLAQEGNNLSVPFLIKGYGEEKMDALLAEDERKVAGWVLANGQAAGAGTGVMPESGALYMPISGQNGVLGVIGVSCYKGMPEPDQVSLFEMMTDQIALALDRERLVEEQEYSKLEIEREKLRSNLLRAVSHDLRTPLTGIAGATATILENNEYLDNEKKLKLLRGIYSDVEWLIRLVENLLSMTRLDEGKLEIKKNLEALEEVVAESVQRMHMRAADHRIRIKIPEKLVMVNMDGKLIEQVLINLIDNAVKYTPKGSLIEIRAYEKESAIVFEVADNGPGIPQQYIGQIFDRFFTAEKVADGRSGVGLGLAICKSIVNAHGGTIKALNATGGGAVFRFSLPAK